ncbi:MAG: preprotein translocase subunit SecE [Planctomycetota bacterium]|jgi:preprotein translocase SecE subunit
MEIYKWGQGVWARGLAIILFLLFAGWGVFEVYKLPAELYVIVRPDDVVWPQTAQRLLETRNQKIRVVGLCNQPVTEDLLQSGIQPTRRIEDENGHGIVLQTETFDREKLQALEKADILFVPVQQGGKPLDAVPVDEWLIGRELAQDVTFKDTVPVEGAVRGVPLDEAALAAIRERFKDYSMVRIGPVFKTKEAEEKEENPQTLPLESVTVGMVPGNAVQGWVEGSVARKDEIITREIYLKIRGLADRGKIPGKKVRISDEGNLTIEPGNVEAIGKRYLASKSNKTEETWWSRYLFTIPLVRYDMTPGILICIGLFILMAMALIYTWNLKRWNDLLIDTQTEMKKVSWPKRSELVGSSVVVIVCVLVLGFYLWLVDFLLTSVAHESGLLR